MKAAKVFRGRGIKPIVQSETSECGLASLAMVANFHGHDVDLGYMRALNPVSRGGMSMAEIYHLASSFGLDARGFAIQKLADLDGLKLPAILHWDGEHFVVLERIEDGRYFMLDPAVGRRSFDADDMSRHFSGIAMEFERRVDVQTISSASGLTLLDILKSLDGAGTVFSKIAITSLALGLLSLATPILLQIALDFVLPQADVDLLGIIAIGLTILLLFDAAGRWLRNMVVLRGAISFQLQFARSLVGHGFRLPLQYFESRHPGDVVTRLDSINAVKDFAVNGMVQSLADGALSVIAVALMFYYSPTMTMAVLATLAVGMAARMIFFKRLQHYTTETLVAAGDEKARLLDALGQVAAVKVHNSDRAVHGKWYDALTRVASNEFLAQKTQIDAQLYVNIMVVVGTVGTLYMGVASVLANTMSIGMLYAFFSLRSSFFDKVDRLTTDLMHLSTLSSHVRRLEDMIVQTPERPGRSGGMLRRIRRKVSLEGVAIRFGTGERPILSDVNLSIDIDAGESIAIVGASGSGKSSLLKVIASLTPPSDGVMLVDGKPIESFGLAEFRDNIGAVFANDGLVRGSVAENVTLFDPTIPIDAVRDAVARVGLADEIGNLPQGLATPISDENGLLSTGQRRRLLAARAICRKPRLLIFDEITANLDRATEDALLDTLLDEPGAKVFVTHSDRLMRRVDRVFRVGNGRFVEVRLATQPPTFRHPRNERA